MSAPPIAPAAARNTRPILDVLLREFADVRSVLEVGSGTGQHAVAFAAAMPVLDWQTSDLVGNHAGINAHIDAAALANVKPPVELDMLSATATMTVDAVFTANTMHIMSWPAVCRMLDFVGESLTGGGLFCCYGPFRRDGRFSTDSNARFDASVRAQDPDMGIRELADVDELAHSAGLARVRSYAMPANNLLLSWVKEQRL